MKRKFLSCVVMFACLAGVAEAQTKVASRFDHVSLVSPDVPRAIQWYIRNIGGKAGTRPDHVWYGQTWILIILAGTPLAPPPPGTKAAPKPSTGGVLDHLAFSYPDVDAKVKELQAAGVKIVSPPRKVRGLKTAFIEDPDGTSIELVEDKGRLGFHHIHVKVPSPDAEMKWIQDAFGGARRTKLRGLDALDYGEMKVVFEKDPRAAPSAGRAIDHLCFLLPTLDALISGVRAKGTNVYDPPHAYANTVVKGDMAFFDSPNGVRFEVLTRTPDYLAPK